MIDPFLRTGEVAVIGLGKSGRSAAMLLYERGANVYASDGGTKSDIVEAANVLTQRGITAQSGGHDLDRIRRARLVVVSPGVPPDAPALMAAREAKIPIISEIEVALRAMSAAKIIAITGTNGKTTTTALIAHLLTAIGLDAAAAGNIGTPLAAYAQKPKRPQWYALEMSSFQLHDTPSLAPRVGVLTNLTPDHLDRYANVEEYYADKARLFSNATDESKWVSNADSLRVRRMVDGVRGEHFAFSIEDNSAAAWYSRKSGHLMLLGDPLIHRDELHLLGDHNVANALAAALAVAIAEPGHRLRTTRHALADGLRSFRPLSHRLEIVGEYHGVQWINDSKATNVDSARVAIAGMQRPTVLLLGGRHKGEKYTSLVDEIDKHVKVVLAYGEAGPLIVQDLVGVVPIERLGSSFETVMARARMLAEPGDAVLLSPACSSYDMFDNYEVRGAEFRRLAAAP